MGSVDSAPREGALAQVWHASDGGLELAEAGPRLEAGHRQAGVAEENHAHTSGLLAQPHPLHQSVHKVLHKLEVLGSDALGTVDHKDQFQRSGSALETTAWKTDVDK